MTAIDANAPIDLRRSTGDRYSILVMLLVMAIGCLVPLGGGFMIASESAGFAVFLWAMAAFIGLMTALVSNEALIRWQTRIQIDGNAVRLSLPSRRSYVPQTPVETRLSLSTIQTIQTRAEAFRAAGNTVLQQAYALVMDDGSRIVLGADRRMVATYYADAAAILAARAGIRIEDLGTVDGDPGILMLWGQTVPGWDAAPLAPEAAETRVRQERRAWQMVSIVVFILLAVRVLVALMK